MRLSVDGDGDEGGEEEDEEVNDVDLYGASK